MDRELLFLAEEPPRIAKEWFERGKKEEDVVFAFISYWITFNQLYSYCSHGRLSEREKIKELIRERKDIFKSRLDMFDPMMDVFLEAPVLEGSYSAANADWSRSRREIEEALYHKIGHYYDRGECREIIKGHLDFIDDDYNKLERITTLFMYIYQVRCNLFHGNKTPTPQRDWELVKSSAKILETVLPQLIASIFG